MIPGLYAILTGASTATQAVPIYLSEVAPVTWRGALNICFQMATTLGILLANCINFGRAAGPTGALPENDSTCRCLL